MTAMENQPKDQPKDRPMVTMVTAAYNESESLPAMYTALKTELEKIGVDWEWLVVDDHSTDRTFDILSDLAARDRRVRSIRFSRNFGSHAAITCGFHHARGDCAIVMDADLQDPPEKISQLLDQWRGGAPGGAQVVWAEREEAERGGILDEWFARLYYSLMRRTEALRNIPAACFFLVSRPVLDAFKEFHESHASLHGLITWMGFSQAVITYRRQARKAGQSRWSLGRKIKLVMDTVTSFTYFPIRAMSYVGFLTALGGFAYAGVVICNAIRGLPPQGWASTMVVILILGGIQMIMLGVLGEYLWRALDESRRRPRYIIESVLGKK